MEWSEYIKSTRKRLRLTQSEFAKILGVSFPAVQSWEYGRSKPLPLQQDIIYRINDYIDEQEEQDFDELISFLKKITIGAGVAFGLYQLLKILFKED